MHGCTDGQDRQEPEGFMHKRKQKTDAEQWSTMVKEVVKTYKAAEQHQTNLTAGEGRGLKKFRKRVKDNQI